VGPRLPFDVRHNDDPNCALDEKAGRCCGKETSRKRDTNVTAESHVCQDFAVRLCCQTLPHAV